MNTTLFKHGELNVTILGNQKIWSVVSQKSGGASIQILHGKNVK